MSTESELEKIRENQEGHNQADADYQRSTDIKLEKINGVLERIEGRIEDLHSSTNEVKEQVKKTNGRVNGLERYRTGIVMCLGLIVAIIIPLLVYINQIQNDKLKSDIISELIEKFEVNP